MDDLTHISLFSGIGGIDIAAEMAGFTTIGQVERDRYAISVLRSRFGRRVPRWSDIRDLSAGDFKRRTVIDSPTLISGGFPCQPFSCAGKRRGKEDDRYLWPEMFRVVRELRPAWVLGENVAGIVSMELESCCSDLESEGYTVRAFLIPACGVGALHRRERVFIVAHTDSPRVSPGGKDRSVGRIGESVTDIPYSNSPGLSCSWTTRETTGPNGGASATTPGGNWWNAEPAVGRVAHGVPHRVDRLRCLGNAVVPQQVYPILAGIAQIEKEKIMIAQNETSPQKGV